jgi:hypothetical protein
MFDRIKQLLEEDAQWVHADEDPKKLMGERAH